MKTRTIYKHLGNYNNVVDILTLGQKSGDAIISYFKAGLGHFYTDECPSTETELIKEEEVDRKDTIFVGLYAITDTTRNYKENIDLTNDVYGNNRADGDSNDYIDIYEYVRTEQIDDEQTYETCPYCGKEVTLDAELKVQKCPECGKSIVTCSMCQALSDNVKDGCKNCPLEYLAHKMNEEEVAVIDYHAEPSREQSLEVLIGYFAPIIKVLFGSKKAYIGKKFHNTPIAYFNTIRSSEDGGSTNLYKCVQSYHKGYEITYNVETNPSTDEIVAIDLTSCDIITDGNLVMDCVNLEEEIKKSENPAFAEIRDELNTIDTLAKLKAKLGGGIMNTTNGHDAHLVELLNKCWDNKPWDVRGLIMKSLYFRDYDECIDKEIFTADDTENWWSNDWDWEKFAYDYLMKVADDTDLKAILNYLRVEGV